MGVPPLPGRDAARRVAVPDGGPRGCRKVRKNLDGTEFSRWGEIFADDDMAKAMMDRIVHHGRLVTYDRESYRVKHALMRGEL